MTGSRERQRGVVIIMFVLALFLAGSTVVLSALNNRPPQLERAENLQRDLLLAKERLLTFAMLYPQHFSGGPGRLPCGDTDNDGLPNACANSLARLPQRVTLTSGERYPLSEEGVPFDLQPWYYVDASVRSSVVTLNAATAPTSGITLDGVTDIVAVLIQPGDPIASQARPNTTVGNYLESPNTVLAAFSNSPASTRNDLVLPIMRSELLAYSTAAAAAEMRRLLNANHPVNANSYPANLAAFQTVMDAANNWLDGNNWHTTAMASYAFTDANNVSVRFQNCAITYTITFGSTTLGRSAHSC